MSLVTAGGGYRLIVIVIRYASWCLNTKRCV